MKYLVRVNGHFCTLVGYHTSDSLAVWEHQMTEHYGHCEKPSPTEWLFDGRHYQLFTKEEIEDYDDEKE